MLLMFLSSCIECIVLLIRSIFELTILLLSFASVFNLLTWYHNLEKMRLTRSPNCLDVHGHLTEESSILYIPHVFSGILCNCSLVNSRNQYRQLKDIYVFAMILRFTNCTIMFSDKKQHEHLPLLWLQLTDL